MITPHLQRLVDCVKAGDAASMARVNRLVRPVVSHAVERVLKTKDYGTPLGREIQGLLGEAARASRRTPAACRN